MAFFSKIVEFIKSQFDYFLNYSIHTIIFFLKTPANIYFTEYSHLAKKTLQTFTDKTII